MEMMKVKMLITKRASVNGTTNQEYFAGQEYDLPVWLAQVFLDRKLAELPGAEVKQAPAPENKMAAPVKNKSRKRRAK